jgi:nucleoside-diphosphate kinase
MERSFVMIKPDGVKRGLTDEIIQRLTDAGLSVVAQKEMQATRELAYGHYADNPEWYQATGSKTVESLQKKGMDAKDVFGSDEPVTVAKQIREWLADFITSGPVVAMVIEGPEGTVQKIRDIAGATGPEFADKGTIRGDLGEDSYAKANGEKRAIENLMHASESVVEAEREIALWFPELV